jgi:hypothetical protein
VRCESTSRSGHLLGGQPLGDQPQHLGLAHGQLRRGGVVGGPAVLPQHQPGQPGGEDRVAGRGAAHRVDELGRAGRLDQVAGRARLDRLEHVGLLAGRGQHQHLRRAGHRPGDLDAVQAGHLQVADQHVRAGGRAHPDRLLAVTGHADDLQAGGGQVALDRVAPDRVVVGHDDAQRSCRRKGVSGGVGHAARPPSRVRR